MNKKNALLQGQIVFTILGVMKEDSRKRADRDWDLELAHDDYVALAMYLLERERITGIRAYVGKPDYIECHNFTIKPKT